VTQTESYNSSWRIWHKTETIKLEAKDDITLTRKSESLWQDALRRLARNKAAVAGAVIILILI
jgi:hypothetical protein